MSEDSGDHLCDKAFWIIDALGNYSVLHAAEEGHGLGFPVVGTCYEAGEPALSGVLKNEAVLASQPYF